MYRQMYTMYLIKTERQVICFTWSHRLGSERFSGATCFTTMSNFHEAVVAFVLALQTL